MRMKLSTRPENLVVILLLGQVQYRPPTLFYVEPNISRVDARDGPCRIGNESRSSHRLVCDRYQFAHPRIRVGLRIRPDRAPAVQGASRMLAQPRIATGTVLEAAWDDVYAEDQESTSERLLLDPLA